MKNNRFNWKGNGFLIAGIILFFSLSACRHSRKTSTAGSDTVCLKPDIPASYYFGEDSFVRYSSRSFQYPDTCLNQNLDGQVLLSVTVEKNGDLSEIKVLEESKACPEFSAEAIRVVKASGKWTPGKKNGVKVKSRRLIPFRMQVED